MIRGRWVGLIIAIVGIHSADAANTVFSGKTITISTHAGPGGGYDAYARLLARHIGAHIPGNPNVIVVNQPGAGGLTALNYVGRVAPSDGTWLALVSQGLFIAEATKQPGFQVSLASLKWIGNMSDSVNVTVSRKSSNVNSINDAKNVEVKVGSTGVGSISAQVPNVLNALLGTKFKIIYGYQDSAQMNIAMQREELDGRGDTWASYKSTVQDTPDNRQFNILVQIGVKKANDLPNVPLLTDLVAENSQKSDVAQFISLSLALSKPLVAPPGLTKDQEDILRKAFDETMVDPAFLSDAETVKADIGPADGSSVQGTVDRLLHASPDVISKTEQALCGEWQQ